MTTITSKAEWDAFVAQELKQISALLAPHQITLDEDQPHIKGERYLMQAMTTASGIKLILYGKQKDMSVVIKATNHADGIKELSHERTCRTLLNSLFFGDEPFRTPAELLCIHERGYLLVIYEFIDQTSNFLDRPLIDQFDFAMQGLKSQEAARVTTEKHQAQVERAFGVKRCKDYIQLFTDFKNNIPQELPRYHKIMRTYENVATHLIDKQKRIEQYGDFLTHTDFVPHNFRIRDGKLYMLDFSSIRFGNKHESWARFLNFMTLHNPDLEKAILKYVSDNRAPEEAESLHLIRLYRLGEIIAYYSKTLSRSEGDLLALNQARIHFWHEVLRAELHDRRVARSVTEAYKNTRDSLRSPEEKERQSKLH